MLELGNLRAGLVGMGVMGRNHARVLAALPGVDLVGIVDPALTKYPSDGPVVIRSVQDLMELGIDYAVVATPTSEHLNTALEIAAFDVPMLIEKPLAGSLEEAQQIANLFSDKALLGSVGHIERFNPAVVEARKRIEGGQLGSLVQISTRRVGPYPVRITDASIAHDFAIHDIDMASWLSGSLVTSVGAVGSPRPGSDRLDSLAISATNKIDVTISHVVNWISPYRDRTAVITGERGVLEIDTLSASLVYKAGAGVDPELDEMPYFDTVQVGDVVTYAIERTEPLLIEHECFRDAVLGVIENPVPLHEAAHAVAVADAALASVQLGEIVPVGSEFH